MPKTLGIPSLLLVLSLWAGGGYPAGSAESESPAGTAATEKPTAITGDGQGSDPFLSRELEQGQAAIRYLYHSGWAVRTKNHLLVFDYWEHGSRGDHGDRGDSPDSPDIESSTDSRTPPSSPTAGFLNRGTIDPSEIRDQNVTVFVSHGHSDHYDPRILDWRYVVRKIRYVWGWEGVGSPEDVHFGLERRIVRTGGLEILNVHHEFDGIPESAFLVRADGLTILHSGDHGHSRGMENRVCRENILYLHKQAPRLDLLFVPTFGGEMDAIRALEPRAVFPMHGGGHEREYLRFAEKVRALGLLVEVGAAAKSGDAFLYSKGMLSTFLPPGPGATPHSGF